MGFVAEELNETERLNIQRNKVSNMAVVYGKEASMWKVSVAQNSRKKKKLFRGNLPVAYKRNFMGEEAVRKLTVVMFCKSLLLGTVTCQPGSSKNAEQRRNGGSVRHASEIVGNAAVL